MKRDLRKAGPPAAGNFNAKPATGFVDPSLDFLLTVRRLSP